MRIVFDFGFLCQRKSGKVLRRIMRHWIQQAAQLDKPTPSFRRVAASFNKVTAANAGWTPQFRIRGSRHRRGVAEFKRSAAFHITHIMQQHEIAIPILPSRSLSDTLAFYRRLGFDGVIHGHGDYAIVTRGTVELHFFTHRELYPAESSAMCYIRVPDVESIYRAFALAELPRGEFQ